MPMSKWTPQRIISLREGLGLSKIAFAEATGVTRTYVYLLEKWVKQPSKTLMKLMEYMEKEQREGG